MVMDSIIKCNQCGCSCETMLEKYSRVKENYVRMVECCWTPLCQPFYKAWNGWNAMLIMSRRAEARKLNKRKRSHPEQSSTKKKSFKLLQEYYNLQGLDKEKLGDVMESVTNSVARIAHHLTSEASSDATEELNSQFNIYKRLFKSVVIFTLDVFDLEDFMYIDRRFRNDRLMKNECDSLHNCLFPTTVCFEQLTILILSDSGPHIVFVFSLQDDNDPTRFIKDAVEQLSTGKHLDNVCHLWEHEVGDVLRQHLVFQKYRFWMGRAVSSIENMRLSYHEVSDDHRRWTRKVMKSYVPLKKDIKVQLTLELMKNRCHYVMDALYVEIMQSVDLNEVLQRSDYSSVNFELHEVVCGIIEQMNCFFSFKKDLLLHTEELALFPLICGIFLPCESDVIEVVKIANHERRMQGHRFISLRHILSGLAMTRYASKVKKIFSNFDVQERAEFPIYRIYQRADMIAQKKVDKVLKLEDLAEAVFYEAYKVHPCTRLSLPDVHNLSEGSNKRDQPYIWKLKKQPCTVDVECLWGPLLTDQNRKEVFVQRNALHLAKILDKNFPGGISMPKIRQSVGTVL